MAKTPRLTDLAANTMADAFAALFNSGYIRIYDGLQPATGDTAIGSQVLLAELRWNATAFGAAVAGVLTANAITGDASANASGTAAWFRALESNGTTKLYDGSVGVSNADLILSSVTIVLGQAVNITSGQIAVPKS